MTYLQYRLTARGEDGQLYACTLFYEQPDAPDGAQAIAHAEQYYPAFTGIRVASVTSISPDEYAFLVRTMCDCDTWGFQPIS